MILTQALSRRRGVALAALTLIATAMLLALPSLSLAQSAEEEEPQPQPAYRFYGFAGSVTIDGEAAPDGTVIEAWTNGEIVGTGTVREGAWNVDVDYLLGGIRFTVNGLPDTGGPHDALMRGGQAMIELAAVTPEPEPTCPEADTMESGEEPAANDELMSEDCPEETAADLEEETTLGFPNSGNAGLSGGAVSTTLVVGIVLGVAALGAAAGVAWRRTKTAVRV